MSKLNDNQISNNSPFAMAVEFLHAADALKVYIETSSKKYFLTAEQFLVLDFLNDKGPQMTGVLSSQSHIGTNISYALKVLQERDYIEQKKSKLDKRSRLNSLTDYGREVVQDIKNNINFQDAELLRRPVLSHITKKPEQSPT